MFPDLHTAPFERAVVGRAPDAARDEASDRARAGGYAAGYAAGAREAARVAMAQAEQLRVLQRDEADRRAEQFDAALQVLARAAAAAAARTAPVLAEAAGVLHTAALELATAVLGCELADAERSARAALARVLDTPVPAGLQTVRLHPRDLEALRTAGVVPGIAGVELVADPHLAPGDAVGEHPDGFLDARIGAALDRARAALADLDEGAAGAPTAGIGTLPHQRGQRA